MVIIIDLFYFLVLLILIYFINPLNNEEKILTTLFITVSYIVIFSYLLSISNKPMYKYLYIIPLLLILLLIYFKNKKPNKFIKFKNFKQSHIILAIITIYSLFIGYILFPQNPANTTDVQFHSYKAKEIIEEKTIFYKTNEEPYKYYVDYPSGFHSIIYLLSSSVSDILNSIQFMKFYMLILFIFGYYLVGEGIKRGLGIFISLFFPLTNVVYRIIGTLLPNTLGYAMMLVCIFFILKYRITKDNRYIYLFSFVILSLVYIHTFPLIILTLFLISVSIYDLYSKHYKDIIKYWSSYILSISLAVLLILQKMAKSVINYGKSTNFSPEPILKIVHNILAGLGIYYIYIWTNTLKTGILDNINTFIISIVFTFLLIVGLYNLSRIKYNGIPFIILLILLILNIINIKFLHIYIPFFSNQYDSARMAMHIQIIMPIFYGSGLYFLYRLISMKKRKYNFLKIIFISFVLLFSLYASYTNYSILSNFQKKIYVIHQNDLKIFEYINKNNITNQTILNFGEDAAQFLPIYTKNKPVFCYYNFSSGRDKLEGNISLFDIATAIDNKNYTFIVNLCKRENIKYIYISEYLGRYDKGFFNNSKYFKILYQIGNAKLVEIK
ncbi:conserved membrane protein of unknown function [Methanocaldococcus lauensis]|uniref:Uncharacterized protein n=1 Tax=Methanocaldococcus lauensis TaxID=2546128 RepID=A0A8D6PZ50_9EURY|nr:DUF6541 family protein [Methanocaldococcus lauensis]CAB3288495.1 conserved membrane protein of unknown function [Methanocaldococcus lauensis]